MNAKVKGTPKEDQVISDLLIGRKTRLIGYVSPIYIVGT